MRAIMHKIVINQKGWVHVLLYIPNFHLCSETIWTHTAKTSLNVFISSVHFKYTSTEAEICLVAHAFWKI